MLVLFLALSLSFGAGFDRLFEGDVAVPRSHTGKKVPSTFIMSPSKLWSGGIVPYAFETLSLANGKEEPLFSTKDMQLVKDTMSHISRMVPCIKFREVSGSFSGAHLIFSTMGDANNDPSGCWAYVGRQGAQGNKTGQTVNLGSSGCINMGTVLHEIMHSLGASHEQNREDRSQYVRIIQDNIIQDFVGNFKKAGALFSSHRTPYDYFSIMHYSKNAFGKSGAVTIIPLQPNIKLIPSWKKSSLSPIDAMELSRVYEPISKEDCYTRDSLLAYINTIEDLLSYELQNKGPFIEEITASKMNEKRDDRFQLKYAIDGKIDRDEFYHSTNFDEYPWVQLKLFHPANVKGVQIFNRLDCCGERFRMVEFRAGMEQVPDNTKGLLTYNKKVLFYTGPGKTGEVHHMMFNEIKKVKYITVQLTLPGMSKYNGNFLHFTEISVIT